MTKRNGAAQPNDLVQDRREPLSRAAGIDGVGVGAHREQLDGPSK